MSRIPAPSFADSTPIDVDTLEASAGLRVPRRVVCDLLYDTVSVNLPLDSNARSPQAPLSLLPL